MMGRVSIPFKRDRLSELSIHSETFLRCNVSIPFKRDRLSEHYTGRYNIMMGRVFNSLQTG